MSQSDDPRQQSVAREVRKLETDPCQDPFVQSEEVKRLVASLGSSNIWGILKLRDFSQTEGPDTQEKIIQYLIENYPTWICKKEEGLSEPLRVLAVKSEGGVYLVLVLGDQPLPADVGSHVIVIPLCTRNDCQNLNCFLLRWLLQHGKGAVLEVDLVRYLKNLNLDDPDRLKKLGRNPFLAKLLDQSLAQDLEAIAKETNKLIRVSKILAFLNKVEGSLNGLKNQIGNDNKNDNKVERYVEAVIALQIAVPFQQRKKSMQNVDPNDSPSRDNSTQRALEEIIHLASQNNYPGYVLRTLQAVRELLSGR